jgi:hypothetical protein
MSKMFSALPPIADIPGRCRYELSVLLESQLLSLIPQGYEAGASLVSSCPSGAFLDYAKSTKSEALEKNAVSRRQIALPSILKYSFGFQKGPTLLGDLRLSAYGESGALKVLAEGEGAGVEPSPHRSAYSGVLRRTPTEVVPGTSATKQALHDLFFGVYSAALTPGALIISAPGKAATGVTPVEPPQPVIQFSAAYL